MSTATTGPPVAGDVHPAAWAIFREDGVCVATMTKAEREELAKVARLRAKAARAGVEARQADLLADVERQLSAEFRRDHELWADITREAEQYVREADGRIAALCRERGVREDFRPGLVLQWYKRGENASKARRDELRRLAEARIEAAARTAKVAIQAKEAEVLTELVADGLDSDAARKFLASMPAPEQLMPSVNVAALDGGPQLLTADDLDDDGALSA
jgi:hypothetical protein